MSCVFRNLCIILACKYHIGGEISNCTYFVLIDPQTAVTIPAKTSIFAFTSSSLFLVNLQLEKCIERNLVKNYSIQ